MDPTERKRWGGVAASDLETWTRDKITVDERAIHLFWLGKRKLHG